MLRYMLLSLLGLLVGCSTHYSIEAAPMPSPSPVFEPVSVFIDDGTQGSGNAYPYDREIFSDLQNSGLFSAMAGLGADNQLIIQLQDENHHSVFPFLLSSATLFILPVKTDKDITLLAQARRHGATVAAYHYDMKFSNFGPPILDLDLKSYRRAIAILVSHLKADLARQPPFPVLRSVECCPGGEDVQI
ncbi:MAG TPA: hypothetical protein VFX91_06220 [Alcanivorax sp.]|nr:hypothetical protein [Alcanivorax sp.]